MAVFSTVSQEISVHQSGIKNETVAFSFQRCWAFFKKFYFSLCTYFMCTVHVYIYMGIVYIYMGIYVSTWFNWVCTCVYMNVKARG